MTLRSAMPRLTVSDDAPNDAAQRTKIAYIDGHPATVHILRAHLVVHPTTPMARNYILDQSIITVGSLQSNDIVIEDETVSRLHCRIVQLDDSYLVTDLGSTNGTHINGVRIREAWLAPGAILMVGNTPIRFNPRDEAVAIAPLPTTRLGAIVGQSVKMREIFDVVTKIAPTQATVVIEGETGTGKEVVARTLHELSPRKSGPFIVFDCGAVPESLIESELFGHEKGSFTGAIMARKGLFEMAQGGTIFLDELGELSLDLQPKLLRVLEQREVRRVGSNKSLPVNVRIIAATNRNLEQEVRAGRFREDLFYRLSVVRLFLPALRERKEDIALLCQHFLDRLDSNHEPGGARRCQALTPEAMEALMAYHWPGNARELVNVMERALSFCEGEVIAAADLPAYVRGAASDALRAEDALPEWTDVPRRAELNVQPFKLAKEQWISSFERDYISELLARHRGNISHAARAADIDRKYFRKLMAKYDIAGHDDPC